jgi:hypothetical protein
VGTFELLELLLIHTYMELTKFAESKLCTDVGAQKVVYAPMLSVMHRSCLLCTDCVPYAPIIQK